MAIINALGSVNTETFPELRKVDNGLSKLFDADGGYESPTAGKVDFVYPNAATLKVTFFSATSNFTYDGIGIDAIANGTVSSLEVRKAGGLVYEFTGFDPFTLAALYADASTGLKTFPALLLDGDDTLNGSPLADVLFAFGGNDTVFGFAGDDGINGGADRDILYGGEGNDSIDGGAGNDDLIGGRGADRLTGGGEGDAFIFNTGDSSKKASGRDTITDFNRLEGDIISIAGIDAKKGGGDNAFVFIGKKPFHEEKGELRYSYKKKSGDSLVQGDINGDGKADFAILVENFKKLKDGDFDL